MVPASEKEAPLLRIREGSRIITDAIKEFTQIELDFLQLESAGISTREQEEILRNRAELMNLFQHFRSARRFC